MRPAWCPDFSGARVLLVASGPSAPGVPLPAAKGQALFVAVNESWRLCPWAELLYGADGAWWRKRAGVPGFGGVRATQDLSASRLFPALHHVRCLRGVDRLLVDAGGCIGDGGTSLFQAVNLIVRAGPPRALGFVGADMTLDYGTHWHGAHESGLNNPRPSTIARWKRAVDGIADALGELGVAAFNLSAVSALENYRKVTLQDFLET